MNGSYGCSDLMLDALFGRVGPLRIWFAQRDVFVKELEEVRSAARRDAPDERVADAYEE
jgi:hypothetical protein